MGKRTPDQVWRTAAKEAIEEERDFQRAANTTAAEAEQELTAMGGDPQAEREKAREWRRELEERVAARKRKELVDRERARSMRPQRARRVPAIAWLVAAVTGAAVGGGAVYIAMHQEHRPAPTPAPAPTPTPMPVPEPVESAPPPLVSAADLRRHAFDECQVHEWPACLADLDRARAIDPAGDDAPAVKDVRARAIAGIVSNKPPMPKPKP